MIKKSFKVVDEDNLYFGRAGTLIYENKNILMLRVDCGEHDENVTFDKSEVTAI